MFLQRLFLLQFLIAEWLNDPINQPLKCWFGSLIQQFQAPSTCSTHSSNSLPSPLKTRVL
uniref:Uncharacterized protein n=1 Tax=Rhizophora mucronata TaxID=61149 RepID=A0A2P2QN17_RHIMU